MCNCGAWGGQGGLLVASVLVRNSDLVYLIRDLRCPARHMQYESERELRPWEVWAIVAAGLSPASV